MPQDEVVDFACPSCGKRLKAGVNFAGQRVKCPKCLQPVVVPGERTAKQPSSGPAGHQGAHPSDTKKTASSRTPPPQNAAPQLNSVPVASPDDDWLNLGSPAIANLAERQQVVEENKAAKERQRTAERLKQSQRQAVHPAATADNIEAVPPGRGLARPTPAATHGDDDDFRLAPLEPPRPSAAPMPQPSTAQRTPPLGDSAATAPTSAKANQARTSPPASPASPAAPTVDTPKRSIFDDDLPELAELQNAPPRHTNAEKLLAEHAGLPSLYDETPPAEKRAKPKAAQQPKPAAADKDAEYRIACPSCGTAQYARLANKGKKIKCPDCFSEFRIPPPPPGWGVKKQPVIQLTGEDIPFSAAAELEHAQTLESQRKRASQMLEKAQQQVSDEDLDNLYDTEFDTAGFMQRTFGFLRDPVAVAHIIGFAIVFAGVFALGQFAANNVDSGFFGKGVLLLTAIGGPLIGILFALPMLGAGLAIVESVANRQPRVSEWPGFNLFDNAGDVAAVSLSLAGALVPGFLLGSWLGGEGDGAGRIQIAGMMVTTFALFPIFLLSMMDNGSVFAPISSAVVRSFREASEAWGAYYLKTFMAFSAVMLIWFVLLGEHEILAAISGALLPWLVFFTCQQLGVLADGIGEHLSFEFSTDKDEVDEESPQRTSVSTKEV